jgi:hypothetical protein
MRRVTLVLCAMVAACAPPELPRTVPPSGRLGAIRSLIPHSDQQTMWSACLDAVREGVPLHAIDCGELGGGARDAALLCSFDAVLGRRPFIIRGLAAGRVSSPYLLIGDVDGTVAHVQCDWKGASRAFLEYRCPWHKAVFTDDEILCDSSDAPWWFQQKRLHIEDTTLRVHPITFRDDFQASAESARWKPGAAPDRR